MSDSFSVRNTVLLQTHLALEEAISVNKPLLRYYGQFGVSIVANVIVV